MPGSFVKPTASTADTFTLQWEIDKPINLTQVPIGYIYSDDGNNNIIAPVDTYRINLVNPTPMDIDSALIGAAIPLIQAGGFVHDKTNDEHTTLHGIISRYANNRSISLKTRNNRRKL